MITPLPLLPLSGRGVVPTNRQTEMNRMHSKYQLGCYHQSLSVEWQSWGSSLIVRVSSQMSQPSAHFNHTTMYLLSSSPPCLKVIILTTSLYLYLYICLFASDIYELLNGAFQIVPDQLPAWHSLFHSLKMLHFNSALLYVIAINHGILSLNMY